MHFEADKIRIDAVLNRSEFHCSLLRGAHTLRQHSLLVKCMNFQAVKERISNKLQFGFPLCFGDMTIT